MNNRKYLLLIIAGFILWIAETAYFGFNEKPENAVESTLDFIAFTMMFWGIIGDIFSNLTIVKKYNITDTTNITTKTVEFAPKIDKDAKLHFNGKEVKKDER